MRTPANIAKHPIHPMLVAIPIGLWFSRLIDMLALPSPVKRIAIMHMSINLTVVALYVVNVYLRYRGVESNTPVWLSVIAVAMLVVSGWLGGKMVYVHGVAVETPPEPAPASKPHHLGT